MGFHTPSGQNAMDGQAVNVDVNLHDVLLDAVVHSKVPIFDVVRLQVLPEDVRRCRNFLAIFVVVLLVDDVDTIDGQNDADVLRFPTVLDVQGDVEVNLRDLL